MTSRTETKKRRPLLEIAHAVRNAMEASEGEVDAALQALDLELEDKIEAYRVIATEYAAEAESFETLRHYYAKLYAGKISVAENKRERLLQHLHVGLQTAGVEDVRTRTAHAYYTTTVKVEIADEAKFIEAYKGGQFVVTTETDRPDKRAVKAWLETVEPEPSTEGKPVPRTLEGAELVTNKHIQLR